MGETMTRRLAVVCARGGSKGVKGKNLRELAGKPLIAHTLAQAAASGMFDAIAVSSDSDAILDAGRAHGASHVVKRPDEMASDNAAKVPAIRHCAMTVEQETGWQFDTIVDLDCTAPLRNLDDIRGAIALLEQSGCANVVSAMPSRRSPYFNLVELDARGRVRLSKPLESPIVRRQDAPKCFDLNASVFAWCRRALFSDHNVVLGEDTLLFQMPEERSIDIDTELDFRFVEFMMSTKEDPHG
ncbi:cytidylyltransferase domain-containing protein [Magnetospirillum sulfuroxidans]|uniref:Acylneuraminate cytidylyltransferase family protein n=1 Tax=Magnetospirillum sulfuroxidans TaxID=611300 RepID=A0ABS5IH27_9PROT|nr:acylneuraminate cytidylyltransferase family protein [Magnetospirillum sulfuroxidans]MBR9973736.1 acylneuraminate cytidylyltransferase family protein [Magnetospirillum sulfuroxidans]